jgi:hypothetical protein
VNAIKEDPLLSINELPSDIKRKKIKQALTQGMLIDLKDAVDKQKR